MNPIVRNRITRRRKQRGAAMVEGAVVLPVLAVFFGVMMFVHNVAMTKLETQSDTRHGAFSNAAHSCIGSGSWAEIVGIPTGPVPLEADAPDADKDASLDTMWIETQANKTKVAVALKRSQSVTSESHVYCNPYQFGVNVAGAWLASNAGLGWGFMKMAKFAKWALQFVGLWSRGKIL